MFVRTMRIKGNSGVINKGVCSSISLSSDDDNQIVVVEIHPQQLTEDREREKKEQQHIHSTLDNNCHKQNQLASTLVYNTVKKKRKYSNRHRYRRQMVTRSTDIDAAALSLGKRHEVCFHDLLSKEAELNTALADLLSISNNIDRPPSSSSSSIHSRITDKNHEDQAISSKEKNKTSSLSASIDLLNNLLQTFDMDNESSDNSTLRSTKNDDHDVKAINTFCSMLSDKVCANCQQVFATNEQIVNADGHVWHTHCFVCTQCFQTFQNGIYFEHEDRKYCERDFQMLFAPCCAECKQAITGRVIRAVQKCFHPDCFRCQSCQTSLIETGFSKYNGRALCRQCHTKEKTRDFHLSPPICPTCSEMIDKKSLKYKGEFHHAHHFQCTSCRAELDENSRDIHGVLYCLPCLNKLDLPICAACRCLIDDRIISALGKQWHVEHFCCARCAQPFHGNKHFENEGLAYCEFDYHSLFGSTCFICYRALTEVYTACNKKYCAEHFTCSICETKMNEKSRFFDVDATPVCKQCYGKLPSESRKSLEQNRSSPAIFKQSCV